MSDLKWKCRAFGELNITELYHILQLRAEIFVVEQNCVYQDIDGLDTQSYHLTATQDDELVAYTRLLPAGVSYPEPSIGRVVVKQNQRSAALGKELLQRSIEESYKHFGIRPIKISAQVYLKNFYESFGFEQCSDVYDEDGIDHIQMILPVTG